MRKRDRFDIEFPVFLVVGIIALFLFFMLMATAIYGAEPESTIEWGVNFDSTVCDECGCTGDPAAFSVYYKLPTTSWVFLQENPAYVHVEGYNDEGMFIEYWWLKTSFSPTKHMTWEPGTPVSLTITSSTADGGETCLGDAGEVEFVWPEMCEFTQDGDVVTRDVPCLMRM